MPRVLELAGMIDRYGAQSVLGRPISAKEIRRITMAEWIVKSYREMTKSKNGAAWVNEHPKEVDMFAYAAGLVNDE